MKKVIVLFFLILSFSVMAAEPLSKPLLQRFGDAVQQINIQVEGKPELEAQLDNTMMLDKAESMKTLKSLSIYPQIQDVVEANGFDSVDDFVDVSYRIMGGLYAYQSTQVFNGMSMKDYMAQMQGQLEQMQNSGMPEQMMSEMKAKLAEQVKMSSFMEKLVANTSEQDKKFIQENITWVMTLMDQSDGF